eukprot:6361728-Prymnesium_polylepis.1
MEVDEAVVAIRQHTVVGDAHRSRADRIQTAEPTPRPPTNPVTVSSSASRRTPTSTPSPISGP